MPDPRDVITGQKSANSPSPPPPETLCGYRQTEEGPEKVVPCDQPRMKKHLINMY